MRSLLWLMRHLPSIQRQRSIPQKTSRTLQMSTRESTMRRLPSTHPQLLGKRLQNRPMPKNKRPRILLSMQPIRKRIMWKVWKNSQTIPWRKRSRCQSKLGKGQTRWNRGMAKRIWRKIQMSCLRKTPFLWCFQKQMLPLWQRIFWVNQTHLLSFYYLFGKHFTETFATKRAFIIA